MLSKNGSEKDGLKWFMNGSHATAQVAVVGTLRWRLFNILLSAINIEPR
jgi:hypothetical protein